jgi:hypothetical protein
MKKSICLTLACAAGLQAATYNSDWSAFDAGHGQSQGHEILHAAMISGWFSQPLHSANYSVQAGPPSMPLVEPTPGAPVLTIVRAGDQVRISWPASAGRFVLEESAALDGGGWRPLSGRYQDDGIEQFILVPAWEASRFYRLTSPDSE